MSLDNMNREEIEFWAKGCADMMKEVAERGLWRCPECGGLMGTPPCDYYICPCCQKEFGNDAKEDRQAVPLWSPAKVVSVGTDNLTITTVEEKVQP